MELTVEQLKASLSYDPETGVFTWIKTGRVAGHVNPGGYVYIRIAGKLRQAARLAWLYMHGKWPDGNIDHRNRVTGDNRIANLRDCSQQQNLANTTVRRDSLTRLKGVSLSARGRFRAVIKHQGRLRHLGMFSTAEDAHAAYMSAAVALRGEFACGGA